MVSSTTVSQASTIVFQASTIVFQASTTAFQAPTIVFQASAIDPGTFSCTCLSREVGELRVQALDPSFHPLNLGHHSRHRHHDLDHALLEARIDTRRHRQEFRGHVGEVGIQAAARGECDFRCNRSCRFNLEWEAPRFSSWVSGAAKSVGCTKFSSALFDRGSPMQCIIGC